jgi:chemotaxis signal transduction protein
VEVLVLPTGRGRHVLPLAAVRESLPLDDLAPLPGAPPAVLGALNVHGEVLVLLDSGLLLDAEPLEAPTHAAVVVGPAGPVALAAAAAPEVARTATAGAPLDLRATLDPARVAAARW